MGTLTTSELARQGGVNLESIRFYERERLLAKPPRTANGYRMFTLDDVRRVRFIKRAQELGFSLREIKDNGKRQARDRRTEALRSSRGTI